MDADRTADLYEIQVLKARYFRFLDTKQWDELRALFSDDMQIVIEDSAVPSSDEPTFASPEELLSYLRAAKPGKITVHQGHMPEIEFQDKDHATGIWAMHDWVDDPGRGVAWQGNGHYHERYVRSADGPWRIAFIRLTRLRVDAVNPRPPSGDPLLAGPIPGVDA